MSRDSLCLENAGGICWDLKMLHRCNAELCIEFTVRTIYLPEFC